MRIQNELNILSATILVLLAVAIVSLGIIMMTRTVYDLNSRLLELELSNIKRKVESIYNILVETELMTVDKYVRSAQREVVDDLADYQFGESGHLYIITDRNRVIFHRYLGEGETLDSGFADAMRERKSGILEYRYAGKARFSVFDTFEPWDWTIALSITKEEMFAYRAVFVRIVTFVTGLIFLLSLFIFLFFSRRITGAIQKTLACLKEAEGGNLNVRIVPETSTEEIVVLQQGINSMIARIRERTEELLQSKEERMLIERRLLEEELQHKEAEISALQSQINPHFLYNTLECLNSIGALHDVPEIQEIAISLSNLFKYAIKGGKIVTVAEELRSVEDYLRIQKIRFLEKFEVDIRIDRELLEVKMLKFLLQPIVENSIFHGLEPKMGAGRLSLIGTGSDGLLELTVSDNGIGMESASLETIRSGLEHGLEFGSGVTATVTAERRSLGLSNIQNRIRLVYGEQYGLRIESTPHAGTSVSMRLPML